MDVRKQIIDALYQFIDMMKDENKIEKTQSITFNVDIPRNRDHGDYATNLPFVLARELKTKPGEIAKLIKDRFDFKSASMIDHIEIAGGGYLNFFVGDKYLQEMVYRIEKEDEDFGKSFIGKGLKIQIEFVSANPTGPLNVVNARAATIGDSLANVLNLTGFQAYKEFYINDAGVQAELFGVSLKERYLEIFGKTPEIPKEGYHGDYLNELAQKLKEENAFSEFQNPEDIPLIQFIRIGLNHMISKQKSDLETFGVQFDNWYRESKLHELNKPKEILDKLRETGQVFESEGATWFRSTDFGDEKDRVLVKSDGSYTYFLNDIAYHQDKFDRGFQKLVDLWGPDHHGHILRMKAAMQALGHKLEDIEILIVQQVNLLRDGVRIKMSKRTGQIETMKDLIQEVGLDAARFFFLLRGTDSHLDFDLEVAKHQTNDNPVFYVQYAHARVSNIFNQAQQKNIAIPMAKDADLSQLSLPEESEIIKILAAYPDILIDAAQTMEPQRVVRYLMDLSTRLHQYYNQHRVISENEKLTQARLVLMKIIRIVVRNGLTLTGISKPERM